MKMFKDIKIVELASVLAGPLVGTFFSELGANVVKIENKTTGGDITRKWKLSSEAKEDISAYYASANYNKSVLMLDLSLGTDYQKAISEIQTADIVIANFKHGDASKFLLDYETLKKYNPTIIYGEINGYGTNVKRAAFDVVLQAETGFMYMNGNDTSGPIKMPVALIDVLAAHQLKEALLCALIKKLKTNEGSHVSVSLYDTAISSLANQATNWLMAKHIAEPMGTKHPNIAPYGDMFLTQDKKHIVLAVGSNKQFNSLCTVLNLEDEKFNKKFIDNVSRVKNRNDLSLILKDKFQLLNAKKIMKVFIDNNVPAGIVKNMKEVFESNLAQKLVIKEKINGQVLTKIKTVVFKMN